IGEIAAAHVAGVFSLPDACRLVAARGRLMQALPPGGAMLAVQATEAELQPLLAQHAGPLALAAVNGPPAVVVAGDEAAVGQVGRHFAARGRPITRLRSRHAFHSAHMDAMLEPFAQVVHGLTLHPPTLPL